MSVAASLLSYLIFFSSFSFSSTISIFSSFSFLAYLVPRYLNRGEREREREGEGEEDAMPPDSRTMLLLASCVVLSRRRLSETCRGRMGVSFPILSYVRIGWKSVGCGGQVDLASCDWALQLSAFAK
jgi:hypothetical protein